MSSQINFYMMPDDVAELDDYLKKNGWAIIKKSTTEPAIQIIHGLVNQSELISYLALQHQTALVKNYFLNNEKGWLIDEFKSPVIQYQKTIHIPEKNILNPGRLYFKKEVFSENNTELIQQNNDFLQMATKLFNWYKRHFVNTKINSDFTTPRAAEYFIRYKTALV